MKNDRKEPVFLESSFNCPLCGAFAQQSWEDLTYRDAIVRISDPINKKLRVDVSQCAACTKEAVWVDGTLVHPIQGTRVPNEDIPTEAKQLYIEASSISQLSPCACAAILRTVLEKLCLSLGYTEKTLFDKIGKMVAEELINEKLQKAMDSVRIIGNEAVHAGHIVAGDDQNTVSILFDVIDIISIDLFSNPKKISNLYDSIPTNKKRK